MAVGRLWGSNGVVMGFHGMLRRFYGAAMGWRLGSMGLLWGASVGSVGRQCGHSAPPPNSKNERSTWGADGGGRRQRPLWEHMGTAPPIGEALTAPPVGAHGNSAPYGLSINSAPYGSSTNSAPYGLSTNSAPCGSSTNSAPYRISTNSAPYGSTWEQRPLWDQH